VRDRPLDEDAVTQALTTLPGWSRTGDALTAEYRGDRARAVELYASIAALEDSADHHATVEITYNRVGFTLSTHDSGDRITWRDTDLAHRLGETCAAHGFTPRPPARGGTL